jgi:hypothetical protein
MNFLIVMFLSSVLTQQITWTTRTSLPAARAGAGCAVVNDSIYVIGGRDSAGNRYTSNYVYDPVSDSWTTKADMSVARAHICCAAVNGRIYAFGGWVGSTATDVVEEYDPVTNSWQTMTPMPTPRYTICCAVVQNKIYVIGGMNMSGSIFATVEEYDPSADTAGGTPWQTVTNMPTARMGPGCAVVSDTIYVFGGSTYIGGGETTVNQCYDPYTDTWSWKTNMQTARYALGGFAYMNKAYALGGYDYYNYHTAVEVYDPTLDSWSFETAMQYARQSVSVGLIDNKVYVIGGWNNGALSYNEEGEFPVGVKEEHPDRGPKNRDIRLFCHPNPFRDKVEINLGMYDVGCKMYDISIKIYDMSGRVVRSFSLTTNHSAPGTAVSWDGRDESGALLPAGTYILKANGNGINKVKKLMLVR